MTSSISNFQSSNLTGLANRFYSDFSRKTSFEKLADGILANKRKRESNRKR